MLDGLDGVPWHDLRHAYGRADDLPQRLRDLALGTNAARRKAIDDLFASINHQGDVYDASAAAVPFLARIARDTTTPQRWRIWILALLAGIADGNSRSSDEELVRRSRAAVARELPVLLALSDERGTDLAIAWIAGNCEALGATALARIQDLGNAESEPVRQLAFSIALGLIQAGGAGSALLEQATKFSEDFADAREGREPDDSKRALEELVRPNLARYLV